jgi:hypothetical protein
MLRAKTMTRLLVILTSLILVLAACGGDEKEETPIPTTKELPATLAPTNAPDQVFPTPSLTESDKPALELIGATADSCVNEDETQSTVLGFAAIHYKVSTSNYIVFSLMAMDGAFTYEGGTMGEGTDGEQGFGFYPAAFELPPNTPVIVTVTVYAGEDDTSEVSSTSRLTYDCTTGEVIRKSFERG